VRVDRSRLYAVLAVTMAVAYGLGVGSYWGADVVVFTLMASLAAWFCFKVGKKEGIEQGDRTPGAGGKQVGRPVEGTGVVSEPDQSEHMPRSRIVHYVAVSRTKSKALTAWLCRESDIPFERALLSEPRWQTLSGESLEEITRKIPDASTKSSQ